LELLLFKLESKSVVDAGPLLDFLVGDRTYNEHLQIFRHPRSGHSADLHHVLSTYGHHFRLLVVKGAPHAYTSPQTLPEGKPTPNIHLSASGVFCRAVDAYAQFTEYMTIRRWY
jgi:hypothetical protein